MVTLKRAFLVFLLCTKIDGVTNQNISLSLLLNSPRTFIVLSSEHVNKCWPSLENSTLLTVAVWALKTVDSPFLKFEGTKLVTKITV